MPKKNLKRRTLKGRGAYYPGGFRGHGGFKEIAQAALGPVSGLANSLLPGAGYVISGIASLFGLGAYSPVRKNTTLLAAPVPSVNSKQDVGIRYRHQEYLGDLTSSVDWNLSQFRVNPGLQEVFPWLSGLAGSFQKYRIDGLVFYLRSTSSVAVASSENLALGTVLGGFQYKVYDPAPSSKIDFLALSGSRSGKPSEDQIFPMECDPGKNVFGNLLVRTGGVSDDVQKYDHAVFDIATVGFQSEYVLGELWVSYDVLLMAPRVSDGPGWMVIGDSSNVVVSSGGHEVIRVPAHSGDRLRETLGWSITASADGSPAFSLPAGTKGLFRVGMWLSTQNLDISDTSELSFGIFAVTNVDSYVCTEVHSDYIYLPGWAGNKSEMCRYAVFDISTATDSPTQVRVIQQVNLLPSALTSQWGVFIERLPDTFANQVNVSGVSANRPAVLRTRHDFSRFSERQSLRSQLATEMKSQTPMFAPTPLVRSTIADYEPQPAVQSLPAVAYSVSKPSVSLS